MIKIVATCGEICLVGQQSDIQQVLGVGYCEYDVPSREELKAIQIIPAIIGSKPITAYLCDQFREETVEHLVKLPTVHTVLTNIDSPSQCTTHHYSEDVVYQHQSKPMEENSYDLVVTVGGMDRDVHFETLLDETREFLVEVLGSALKSIQSVPRIVNCNGAVATSTITWYDDEQYHRGCHFYPGEIANVCVLAQLLADMGYHYKITPM